MLLLKLKSTILKEKRLNSYINNQQLLKHLKMTKPYFTFKFLIKYYLNEYKKA
jgi:hypothetical protein